MGINCYVLFIKRIKLMLIHNCFQLKNYIKVDEKTQLTVDYLQR